MKPTHPGKRPTQIATALSALLFTASCTSPQQYALNERQQRDLDGGVGQLLRYCTKFQESGDLVTAAGLCERAHRIDQTDPEPLLRLADILTAMNQPLQAVAAYQIILETTPGYVEAHYRLGKTYIALEQYDLAQFQFQTALQHKIDDPRVYNALGIVNGLIGEHGSAQEVFQAGLKVAPTDVSLRNNLGLSLALSGSYAESIAILQEVAAAPNANETSLQNLQLAQGLASTAQAEAELAAIAAPIVDAPMAAVYDESEGASSMLAIRPEETENSASEFAGSQSEPNASANLTTGLQPFALAEMSSPASPTAMQTANATTTDTSDADTHISLMTDYLSVDIQLDEATGGMTALSEVKNMNPPESKVATLQPSAQSLAAIGDQAGLVEGYAVQFASYRSESRAWRGWDEISATTDDLLTDIKPMVRRADLGADSGIYYRLRTSPGAKDTATKLCADLKSRGIDCLVVKEQPETAATGAARL